MQKLFKTLGITPVNLQLYTEALTHSSYSFEKTNRKNNERLEFLGDSVLQIIVSDFLFKKPAFFHQGLLTKKRSQIVREEALFLYAQKIKLSNYLFLGKSELTKKPSKAIIADAFEALIAAIYLDLGFNIAYRCFIDKIMLPLLPEINKIQDFKTILQEIIQNKKKTLFYQTRKQFLKNSAFHFVAQVFIDDDDVLLGEGTSYSKKNAEQVAAKNALQKLKKKV